MSIWTATGVASVNNGSTIVTTTADFRANYIERGKGFQFPDDPRFYQITALDERNGQFTIQPAYQGTSKAGEAFWVLPFLGVAQSAERALRDAADAMQAVLSPDPLDMTPGRLLRLGDFGGQGYAVLLSAEHDLNNITVPGLYCWRGDSVPLNAPPSPGSHFMRVEKWDGNGVIQFVARFTQSGSSMVQWWRDVFPEAEPVVTSPWARDYNSRNIIGTVSQSSGIPTGALVQAGRSDSPWWRAERHAWGSQVISMEVEIDVGVTTSQVFNYPAGFNFVSGGKVVGSYSYRSSAPNAALYANNVRLVAFNANITVRLGSAGTPPVDPDDTIRLMLRAEGLWFNAA